MSSLCGWNEERFFGGGVRRGQGIRKMSLERLAGAVSQGFLLGQLRRMDFILSPVRTNRRRGVTWSELLFRIIILAAVWKVGWKGTRRVEWSLSGGWDIIQDERAQGKVVEEGSGDEIRQEVALSESGDWLESREASGREMRNEV